MSMTARMFQGKTNAFNLLFSVILTLDIFYSSCRAHDMDGKWWRVEKVMPKTLKLCTLTIQFSAAF